MKMDGKTGFTEAQIQHYGDELYNALITRTTVAPLLAREPLITIDDAYRIQQRMVARRLEAGEHIVGKKIGVTSKAVQDMIGVTRPDFGQLTSGMAFVEGQDVSLAGLIQPKAEAEVAFVLKHDLKGPGITATDVIRATDYVVPCFEIVDSRVTDWKIKIQDTIADNAAFGAIVLGGRIFRPFDIDVRWVAATLSKNGVIEESGVSAAIMGHPAAGIAWLVNKLAPLGEGLRNGDIVLGGSFTRPVDIAPGDVIFADYGPLGSIGVSFE